MADAFSEKTEYISTDDFANLTSQDWAMFALGYTLGFFVTLASSGFLALFGDFPCLVQWALIIQSLYSFYVYMKVYEESNFTDSNFMFYMIFGFIQFGEAINLGICPKKDDHGFNSSRSDKSFFDMDHPQSLRADPYGFMPQFEQTSYFVSLFSFFGQSNDDTAASIIAVVGVLGI